MTTVDPLPHASWASVYDEVYERSFGSLYAQMTTRTLEVISGLVAPPAPVVDFGAGTGRLSVPLARLGYRVTAVDPCREMLNELHRKAPEVQRAICPMSEFDGRQRFDLAVCIFTVLPYILDSTTLQTSFAAVGRALSPTGRLLLDIPARGVFTGYTYHDERVRRSVTVTPGSTPFYQYREQLSVRADDGRWRDYSDRFQIRLWSMDEVLCGLRAAGFSCERELSASFAGTGSRYFQFRRVASEQRFAQSPVPVG